MLKKFINLKAIYTFATILIISFGLHQIYILLKSHELDTQLVKQFSTCHFENQQYSCWKTIFNDYIKGKFNLGIKEHIIAKKLNNLICDSTEYSEYFNTHDLKRKCYNILSSVFFTNDKTPEQAIYFCENLKTQLKSGARFCMGSYYTEYYKRNPKLLSDKTPLNIDFCRLGRQYITNCLRAEITNYVNDLDKFEKKIKSYCNIDLKYKESCYVAFGSVAMATRLAKSTNTNYRNLCSNIPIEYRFSCIKGMLNTFLIENFNFEEATSICKTQSKNEIREMCLKFVENDFLINR